MPQELCGDEELIGGNIYQKKYLYQFVVAIIMSSAQRVVHRSWHLFDANKQVVGKLSGNISRLLAGKHKPNYDPRWDGGDNVVVINAKKVVFEGDKWRSKKYRHHTGYPGGLKTVIAKDLLAKFPERILQKAVNGMLPKTFHRASRMRRLHIFDDEKHPFIEEFKNAQVLTEVEEDDRLPWERISEN